MEKFIFHIIDEDDVIIAKSEDFDNATERNGVAMEMAEETGWDIYDSPNLSKVETSF